MKRIILIGMLLLFLVGCYEMEDTKITEEPIDGSRCIAQFNTIFIRGHYTNLSLGNKTINNCCCVDYGEFVCHCPSMKEISAFFEDDS